MRNRLANVLAWAALLSLLFGVIPLASLAIGYQLEKIQTKPVFANRPCEDIQASGFVTNYDEATGKEFVFETFDPEKCRIAGSGTAIQWIRGKEVGFIYANLSKAQIYERLGYRTFFHDISNARFEWTMLFASPWLPLVLLLYVTTGKFRILPWRKR